MRAHHNYGGSDPGLVPARHHDQISNCKRKHKLVCFARWMYPLGVSTNGQCFKRFCLDPSEYHTSPLGSLATTATSPTTYAVNNNYASAGQRTSFERLSGNEQPSPRLTNSGIQHDLPLPQPNSAFEFSPHGTGSDISGAPGLDRSVGIQGPDRSTDHAAAAFTSVAEAVATAPAARSHLHSRPPSDGRPRTIRQPDPVDIGALTLFDASSLFQR